MTSTYDHEGDLPPGRGVTQREDYYVAVRTSPEFQELRHKYRRFVLPVTAASLLWYFLYVLLAAYARDFMAQKVFGEINVGLILGLLQFVTTFAVTAAYVRYADRVLDPLATRIRERMEAGGLR